MQADNEAGVVRTLDDRELFPVSVQPRISVSVWSRLLFCLVEIK